MNAAEHWTAWLQKYGAGVAEMLMTAVRYWWESSLENTSVMVARLALKSR